MTFPADVVDWARGKLKPLLRRRGAPASLSEQETYAASVLRIAHPGLVRLRVLYQDRDIPQTEIDKALKMTAAELAAIAEPLDWLIQTADDEALWFVEPVDLREMFIERYPCADGKKKFTPRGGKDFKKK